MNYLQRLEYWAARMQGKGWGSATCEHEVRSIKKLLAEHGRPDPQVVFDVGANVGDWTQAALPLFKHAKFFLFEPAHKNVEILKGKFTGNDVSILPLALSNKEGQATLFSDAEGSGLASLQKRELEHLGIDHHPTYAVAIMSLNRFMKTEKLDRIDLLKIDVEGHELAVLEGATDWLEKIDAIQFEFGGTHIDSRTFFRDFWFLLSPHFAIYRVARFYLHPVTCYSEADECFRISNYIAINKGK